MTKPKFKPVFMTNSKSTKRVDSISDFNRLVFEGWAEVDSDEGATKEAKAEAKSKQSKPAGDVAANDKTFTPSRVDTSTL